MNTRVQVEHPVTELVTGIDIVKEGIRVAAGEHLSVSQEDIELRGHAIECRINAEDASKNFAPAPGRITGYREPAGPGVRVDSGVEPGSEISPMYDPIIAKLIVWDVDREQATARMVRALREYEIGGCKTLLPFHEAILQTRQWADAETCRDLIEDREWLKSLGFPKPVEKEAEEAEPVEQSYTVEVSGKRFDVKVIGPPFGGGAQSNGADPAAAVPTGASPARRGPRRSERGRGGARRRWSRRDHIADSGHRAESGRRGGRDDRGGSAHRRDRGDEDGERDHRPQVGHDLQASDLCGQLGGHRRHAGRDLVGP